MTIEYDEMIDFLFVVWKSYDIAGAAGINHIYYVYLVDGRNIDDRYTKKMACDG